MWPSRSGRQLLLMNTIHEMGRIQSDLMNGGLQGAHARSHMCCELWPRELVP